jgi:hypothetical protein
MIAELRKVQGPHNVTRQLCLKSKAVQRQAKNEVELLSAEVTVALTVRTAEAWDSSKL